MNPLLILLARFTVRGLPDGSVTVICVNCGTTGTFGRRTLRGGVTGVSDLARWCEAHVCPEEDVPVLSRVLELSGVA